MALRLLFTDHAVYTKFVVVDILEGLGNTKADLARLLENQEDIGRAIGGAPGRRLTTLLKTHIKLAGACVTALKAGSPSLKQSIHELFENSDEVGEFLHSLNPSKLPLKATQAMFHTHNQYVLNIAIAQHKKQYAKVVTLFDRYYEHMIHLSDTLESAL